MTASGAGWRSRYRRLRGVDQMYLTLEAPETPMHFGALVVLEGGPLLDAGGRLRLDDLRQRIDRRVATVPELRRAIHRPGPLAGAPLWLADRDFRIERHVGEVRLPPGAGGEAALLGFVEALMRRRLDRSHPLWRLWFITGQPGGQVAMLFMVHHALTDGLGAIRLAGSILAEPMRPEAGPDGPMRDVDAEAAPPWRDLVRDNVRGALAAVDELARPATRRALAEAWRSFRVGWTATRGEPTTSLSRPVGPGRRVAVLRLDAARLKRIARELGCGVNDVVLALVAGGVRALLASRGEPIDRLVPRAGIAVTLPPSERRGDATNHFGSYVVALPIREADPAARIRAIAVERDRARATQAVTGVTGVRVWTTRFPPTRALMRRQRFIHVMETFLPGPPRPIELLGARVLDLVPLQPLGRSVGLTFIASSYAGCVTLTVRADPDAFPDLDRVLAAMTDEWDGLRLPAAAGAALAARAASPNA